MDGKLLAKIEQARKDFMEILPLLHSSEDIIEAKEQLERQIDVIKATHKKEE